MTSNHDRLMFPLVGLLVVLHAGLAAGCTGGVRRSYDTTLLVSSESGAAPVTDPSLVNPWGLARGPFAPFVVANEATGTLTEYGADGTPQPVEKPTQVPVPPMAAASPTGLAFNTTTGFILRVDGREGPSEYLLAGRYGQIAAWSADVTPSQAVIVADRSAEGAVYTGVTVATDPHHGPLLYAANFAAGRVDVFGGDFAAVDLGASAFVDPKLPDGYVPFGIRAFGQHVWVTYALRSSDGLSDVPGAGHGVVNEFDTAGGSFRRVVKGGQLDSPWGLEQVSHYFTGGGEAVLVSNHGDGRILAYNVSGNLYRALRDPNGNPIAIDGLWGIRFRDGSSGPYPYGLYFTAGPNGGSSGVFGVISPH